MPVSPKPRKRNSVAGAALRIIRMLRLIPREPNKTTTRDLNASLATQGFVVDKRSV